MSMAARRIPTPLRPVLDDPRYNEMRARWKAMNDSVTDAVRGREDGEDPTDLERILTVIQAQGDTRRMIEEALDIFVPIARSLGATWQQIGDALGVERQVVWRKYNKRAR